MIIEQGKFYMRADGVISTIIRRISTPVNYPWSICFRDGKEAFYLDDGDWTDGDKKLHDYKDMRIVYECDQNGVPINIYGPKKQCELFQLLSMRLA